MKSTHSFYGQIFFFKFTSQCTSLCLCLCCAHGIIITQFNHTDSGVCILLCIPTCHLYACTLKSISNTVYSFNSAMEKKNPSSNYTIVRNVQPHFFLFLFSFSLFLQFYCVMFFSMKAYATPRPTPIFSTCNRSLNCIPD